SIYPNLTTSVAEPILAWHGINTELLMTLGIIVVGTLLYVSLSYWKVIYRLFPTKWSFDRLYNGMLSLLYRISHIFTSFYIIGFLRHYFQYFLVFFIISLGIFLINLNAISFDISHDKPVGIFELIMSFTIIVAGIVIVTAKTRLTAILVNGYIG